MLNFLIVGAGGFVGAAARYGISLLPLNERGVFPLNTLIINVIGAFVIGLISAAAAKHTGLDGRTVLFLKTGICGGFTTFSTFALETVTMFEQQHTAAALAYIVLSVALSAAAVYLAQAAV